MIAQKMKIELQKKGMRVAAAAEGKHALVFFLFFFEASPCLCLRWLWLLLPFIPLVTARCKKNPVLNNFDHQPLLICNSKRC